MSVLGVTGGAQDGTPITETMLKGGRFNLCTLGDRWRLGPHTVRLTGGHLQSATQSEMDKTVCAPESSFVLTRSNQEAGELGL